MLNTHVDSNKKARLTFGGLLVHFKT